MISGLVKHGELEAKIARAERAVAVKSYYNSFWGFILWRIYERSAKTEPILACDAYFFMVTLLDPIEVLAHSAFSRYFYFVLRKNSAYLVFTGLSSN
jgi:hypothetical protein